MDFRLHMSASAYVSSKFDRQRVEEKLAAGVGIASAINSKMARFLHLALEESDSLKKFIYFFLAIEIETHATFRKIDHTANVSALITVPDRMAASAQGFFEGQHQRWTNLRDRFVWCALCVWTHLRDTDVEEFKRLKEIRDDIAHGSAATPPAEAVTAIELLALRIATPQT